jgi:transcriptional regulator GlxA family with amidase domain
MPVADVDSGSPGATVVCGVVEIAGPSAVPLIGSLPVALTVGGAGGGSGDVALTLRLIDAEAGHQPAGRSIGSQALLARLGDVLFMQILRAWLQGSGSPQPTGEGWFAAMRDPQIGTALVALHAEPAMPWTVSSLAGRAGLSRSRFAERFTALVGESPLAYLTRWRLNTAAQLLVERDRTVRDVARAVGYGSESAFSRAFTRHHGVPPSHFPAR